MSVCTLAHSNLISFLEIKLMLFLSLHLGAVELMVGQADRHHEEERGEAPDLLPAAVAEVTVTDAIHSIGLQQTVNVRQRECVTDHR